MMKRTRMNLHLFEEGGQGGDGGTGSSGGGNGSQGNAGGTFTYEQLDEIARSRTERAEKSAVKNYLQQKGMSEEEANAAFNQYKQQKAKNQPNVTAIEQERDNALKELQQLKNTNILRDKGVKSEDLDYVMFKVEKLVDDKTDFTKAAEKFLKENPRFTNAGTYRVSTSTSTGSQGAGGNLNDSINNAIRNAIRR